MNSPLVQKAIAIAIAACYEEVVFGWAEEDWPNEPVGVNPTVVVEEGTVFYREDFYRTVFVAGDQGFAVVGAGHAVDFGAFVYVAPGAVGGAVFH